MPRLSGPTTVNIPFRKVLEVGQTKFKVGVPRRYLDSDDMEYAFGFDFATLIPEYYSRQALLHNMDPEDQGNYNVDYPIYTEFEYKDTYYVITLMRQYIVSADPLSTGKMIADFNAAMARIKPTGTDFPPAVIDWFTHGFEKSNLPIRDFHELASAMYFDDKYDPTQHLNALPLGARTVTYLNNLVFPTTKDPEVIDKIRIRITLAPNVRLAFSNDKLLKQLGYFDAQIPPKSSAKQHNITNKLTERKMQHISDGNPSTEIVGAKNSKVTVYVAARTQTTREHIVKTTRMRELNPQHLLEDVTKVLERIAKNTNQTLGIELQEGNRFKVLYSDNVSIKTRLLMPPRLSKLLGFHGKRTIESPEQPDILKPPATLSDSESQGRTLVFDVGMVAVNLEEYYSEATSNFPTINMANLEADYSGTMQTRMNHTMPRVHVTYFKPELEFALNRFDEKGNPSPLGLPCSAYIQGVLSGKSINSPVQDLR